MKSLFVVACKIIGLLQLYWAFATLLEVGLALGLAQRSAAPMQALPVDQAILYLGWTILCSILAFAVSYLMIFKTDMLSRLVGVPNDAASAQLPPHESLLRTGILLIGVYFVLGAIPGIAQDIRYVEYAGRTTTQQWLGYILGSAGHLCQIGLAVLLLKIPDKVIQLITGNSGGAEPVVRD